MRTQYLKSWETLFVFVCLIWMLSICWSRATCTCDPEETVQFKLQGSAWMAGSATVKITYGDTVQTTTLTTPDTTAVWNGSQWTEPLGYECAQWQAQITVNPKLDQPVLIEYIFNSDNQNPATPYADFPQNGSPNPLVLYSRPSMPCLHVWVDLNDDNWIEDPVEVFAFNPTLPQFRIKGVVEGDDSSTGFCPGPEAGGGQPQPPAPELNDAEDFAQSDLDSACSAAQNVQMAPLAVSSKKAISGSRFAIRPASSMSLSLSNHVSADKYSGLQQPTNGVAGVGKSPGSKSRSHGGSKTSTNGIVVRPDDLSPNGYSVFDQIGLLRWTMSLGSQSGAFTLGHLVYQSDNIADTSGLEYTPATLSLADGSDPMNVITDTTTGYLRQIRLQNGLGLVNIVTISDGFEIDVYPEAQVGGMSGGLYTFSGSPSVTWKVEDPDATPSGRVKFTQIEGSTTYVHMAQWAGTSGSSGTMTITRFNGKWEEVTVYASVLASGSTPNERIETVSKYKNGTLQHKTKTTYAEMDGWGNTGDVFEAVVQRVEDPDGQALTTTYGYYSDQPEIGQEIDPDGYQEVFPNRVFGNGLSPVLAGGSPLEVLQPFGDNLGDRQLGVFNRAATSSETFNWLVITTNLVDGQIVGFQKTFHTFGNGAWDMATYSSMDNSGTFSYQEQAVDIGNRRLLFSEDAQGRTKIYVRGAGFWDGSTFGSVGTFAIETVITNGTAGSPQGIANQTTIDVTVEDQFGHLFEEASYINDLSSQGDIQPANLISETIHEYGTHYYDAGSETARYKDGRLVYQATYNADGTLASETDESGQQITYTHDELLRVYQKTIHGRGGDADQVITYEYDVLGNEMSETRTAGGLTAETQWSYDLAGDLQSTTGPDGLTMQFLNDYSTGRKIVTQTLPTQATKISGYFLDRSLMSLTGTAVDPEYQSAVIFPWNGGYAEGRQVYRDSAKTQIKYSRIQNWLGDELVYETPQFQLVGYRDRVTYYDEEFYDQEPDGDVGIYTLPLPFAVTETGRAAKVSTYDALGRLATQGYDLNGNGVLDPTSTEPITTYSRQFTLNGSTWSDVSTVQQYKQDNSSAETLVRQTSTVVSAALAALGQNLISQSTVELAGGGTTLTTVTLDSTSGNYTTTVNDQEHNQVSTSVQRDGMVRSETMPGIGNSRTYTYTALSEKETVSDPVTGTLTYAYDPNTRQLTSVTDSLTHETDYIYYPAGAWSAGLVKGRHDPNGNWTYFTYNGEGQIYQEWGVNTYPVRYVYDTAGHMLTMTTYRTAPGTVNWASSTWPNPPGGDTTQWDYDTASQLLQRKLYPDFHQVTYTYNSGNFLQTKLNGRRQTITYGFDTLGRLHTLTYSDGTPSATLGYDRAGRLVSATDASGTHSVNWTDRDQMENETYTAGLLNGVTVSRAYDSAFRLQQIQFEQSGVVQTYEEFGYTPISWLDHISEMSANGSTELRRYQYALATGLPFVQSVAYSSGGNAVMTQNYTHDGLGRLQAANVALAGGSTPYGVSYQFDNLDRRYEADLADGTKWSYGYNNRSEVTSGARVLGSGAYAGGKQYAYTYDDIGNRLTASFGGDATGANLRQSTYTANLVNQLTNRTVPGSVWLTGDAPNTLTLEGLANGQAITVQQQENNQFFAEVTADNSPTPVYLRATVAGMNGGTLVDFHSGNKFLARNPQNFTYDNDGNLTNDGQWQYTWDAESRLIQVVSATAVGPQEKIQFGYDWMGRRISKTVWNNTTGSGTPALSELFAYDQWNLAAILNSQFSILQTFMWGSDLNGTAQGLGGVGGLLSTTISSGTQAGTYFYGYDGNGNVMELVGTDQSIQATYEYGPFGEVIGATGPLAEVNAFGFSTKYQDNETGLLYYGYRYYNPSTGKWLSRDPGEENGGLNLYEFGVNDGIDGVDVLGMVLEVAGKTVKNTDKEYVSRQGDPVTKEVLDKMIGSTETFSFKCWPDFDKNRDLRKDIIQEMKFANDSPNLNYTGPGQGPAAPAPDWVVSPAKQYSYISSGAKSSYAAINSFFNGPTYLECLTCAQAIGLKAQADVLGQKAFDTLFPSPLRINQTAQNTALILGIFYPATDLKTIVPGDWVYFKNNANYLNKDVHPDGYWQGENAIYAGGGIFSGFGAANKTIEQMRQELLDAYNKGLAPSKQIQLQNIPDYPQNIQRPRLK